MIESPSSTEVVVMADRLLTAHPVETARGKGRLNALRSAGLYFGRDYLAVDQLGDGGYRFVYFQAQGPLRESPTYQATTLLWHGDAVGVSTLVNNHANAGVVLAHFMQAAG